MKHSKAAFSGSLFAALLAGCAVGPEVLSPRRITVVRDGAEIDVDYPSMVDAMAGAIGAKRLRVLSVRVEPKPTDPPSAACRVLAEREDRTVWRAAFDSSGELIELREMLVTE